MTNRCTLAKAAVFPFVCKDGRACEPKLLVWLVCIRIHVLILLSSVELSGILQPYDFFYYHHILPIMIITCSPGFACLLKHLSGCGMIMFNMNVCDDYTPYPSYPQYPHLVIIHYHDLYCTVHTHIHPYIHR